MHMEFKSNKDKKYEKSALSQNNSSKNDHDVHILCDIIILKLGNDGSGCSTGFIRR
jgi:hypothetical protein